MPLDKDAMREYQRKRRAKTGETNSNLSSEGASGDPNHEHYWLRKLGDDFAVCTEFEMQGRKIGGCGERRAYTGKLLPSSDHHPDLSQAIVDSPMAREIQQKMPVTKGREPR